MATYINGVIVSKSAPKLVNQERGTYAVEYLMQYEWHNDNPNFNKYIAFSVFGDRDNKRISTLNIQVNDDIEVALDINARPMFDRTTGQQVVDENGYPRYITSITCFGVERDKSKFHRYERRQRTASGMPIAQRNESFAQAAANHAAAPTNPTATAGVTTPTAIPTNPAAAMPTAIPAQPATVPSGFPAGSPAIPAQPATVPSGSPLGSPAAPTNPATAGVTTPTAIPAVPNAQPYMPPAAPPADADDLPF